ncbi:IS1182 family transposase [Streptomyces umbrinus]|uniref:IS1182 family transposase n=1 Tax=Streptomyces umbrinus TaxID=67370 RepID=UPI003C2EF5EA
MSLHVQEPGEVPAETVRVARKAFPKGSLAIRVRDELGVLFRDEAFSGLFPARGKPAWSPGRLALVLVLQFVEGLSDRQAAEAVRARIDWKYALGLELGDAGFDYSVLSEFRDRLVAAEAGRELLDAVLKAAGVRGLLKTGGKARTDSTHVLSSARELCWLEQIGETLRAALNAVAHAAPDWMEAIALPDWFKHYATRLEDSRFPKSRSGRDAIGLRIGGDGMHLLQAVHGAGASPHLRELPAVGILRQVWVQHFQLVDGEVQRRGPKDRPPGAKRLVTPYDPDARCGVKRDTMWDGYKVHLTETCETGAPNLLTHVATTVATVPDIAMTTVIHTQLAERERLPTEHFLDAGYVDGPTLVATRRDLGVEVVGPMPSNTSSQADSHSGAYSLDAFSIDWDNKTVTCPGGSTTSGWKNRIHKGNPSIRIWFSRNDCQPCPVRSACISSPTAKRRELEFRHQDEHDAIRAARATQQTPEWKQRYKTRAGVEGTISQGVLAFGLRRSRYRGLGKTSLQHQLTGAAINLARIDAWLTHRPRARTRTSHLTALRPAG